MSFSLERGSVYIDGKGGRLPVHAAAVLTLIEGPQAQVFRDDLGGLRFDRRPLAVRLAAYGAFPDGMHADFVVHKGVLEISVDGDADQVVVGGTWHPLDGESVEAAAALAAEHGIEVPGPLSPGRYLRLLADPQSAGFLVDRVEGVAGLGNTTVLPIDVPPPGLKANLFPYQVSGAARLRCLARDDLGALLADEMGLGKTLQAIVLLLDQVRRGPLLVVAPASLLINWEREIGRFAPALRVLRHSGPGRSGLATAFVCVDVVLVSYDTLTHDLGLFRELKWRLVVADEAQNIRNPDARRSVAIKSVATDMAVAVTGTPIENKLQDAWSIGEFILPSLLGDRDAFLERFPDSATAGTVVGRLLSPITIRRTVAEVGDDIPPRMSRVTYFGLDALDRSAIDALPEGIGSMTAERMLCAHAYNPPMPLAELARKPKVAHLTSVLSEAFARGQKALVFASFTGCLDGLRDVIADQFQRVAIGLLDGRVTDDEERQGAIDDFNGYPGPGVLFLNPQAFGTGVNITGANHVVHFQPDWNPALEEQATKRAHRKGQRHPVSVHTFAYVDSLDMRALELQGVKRETAAGVYEGLKDDRARDDDSVN